MKKACRAPRGARELKPNLHVVFRSRHGRAPRGARELKHTAGQSAAGRSVVAPHAGRVN